MSITGTLYVGFTLKGVIGSHYISLVPSASFTADYRVTQLYLSCSVPQDYEVIAGLTGIKVRDAENISNYSWVLSMVLGMPHFQPPPPGQNSVAEYMASTTPFLTASVLLPGVLQEIPFPYVTAWVAVQNVASSGSLQVGFTAQGVTGSNFIPLSQSASTDCSYRLASIFLYAPSAACSYEVIAGLTGIPIRNLTPLVSLTGTIGAI